MYVWSKKDGVKFNSQNDEHKPERTNIRTRNQVLSFRAKKIRIYH